MEHGVKNQGSGGRGQYKKTSQVLNNFMIFIQSVTVFILCFGWTLASKSPCKKIYKNNEV